MEAKSRSIERCIEEEWLEGFAQADRHHIGDAIKGDLPRLLASKRVAVLLAPGEFVLESRSQADVPMNSRKSRPFSLTNLGANKYVSFAK